jgi:hypothetical protein
MNSTQKLNMIKKRRCLPFFVWKYIYNHLKNNTQVSLKETNKKKELNAFIIASKNNH